MAIRIPRPVSVGLMLSYICNCTCKHCMYACSTKWPKNWISEEDLALTLGRIGGGVESSPHGSRGVSLNHGLHLTGGEPFLNFPLLLRATEMAKTLRIPSVFVETNGFWARDEEQTRGKLLLLKKRVWTVS